MRLVQRLGGLDTGDVEGHFGQFGHGHGDSGKACAFVAVQAKQAFNHQLPHGAQRATRVQTTGPKGFIEHLHRLSTGRSGRQLGQLLGVAPANALTKPGAPGQVRVSIAGHNS